MPLLSFYDEQKRPESPPRFTEPMTGAEKAELKLWRDRTVAINVADDLLDPSPQHDASRVKAFDFGPLTVHMPDGLNVGGHTYKNIKRTAAFCVNYPSYDDLEGCQATIDHNDLEDDEITAGGFTAEKSRRIEAPRIAEASLSLECSYVKECEIDRQCNSSLVFGRVLHIGASDAAVQADLRSRIREMDLMLNFRQQIDPVTGDTDPGGVARIDSKSFRPYRDTE